MKNPFRRKIRYTPPNPEIPDFVSAGGKEMWLMMLDIRERIAALEARQAMLMGVLLILVGAWVAGRFL